MMLDLKKILDIKMNKLYKDFIANFMLLSGTPDSGQDTVGCIETPVRGIVAPLLCWGGGGGQDNL